MEFDKSLLTQSNVKFNEAQIQSLSKAFWVLCLKYEFTHDDICMILGKNLNTNDIQSFRDRSILPSNDSDIIMRVTHMLGIHWSLGIIYPHNPSLIYSWMKTKSPEFHGKSPLEIIKDSGYQSMRAIITIRNYLDSVRVAA